LQTTRETPSVAVTFVASEQARETSPRCGLCGRETMMTLVASADAPPCCRACFRKRRAVAWS
jgi:hypothetical protein